MAMRRADRRDSNYDNAVNHPQSRRNEPVSSHEMAQLLMTVRAQRDEWQQRAKENEESASQLVHVQQQIQTYQVETNELKERATQNYQLYLDEQQKYQETLCLYNKEKVKATELLTKYETVNAEREKYLTLYNQAQAELKYERHSKAGIKGWETRRKAENERLKHEIADMVVQLRESLTSKDEALNNLYALAERMDKIQSLVDSAEEETTSNPVSLVQKFRRIWLAIKDILSE